MEKSIHIELSVSEFQSLKELLKVQKGNNLTSLKDKVKNLDTAPNPELEFKAVTSCYDTEFLINRK